MKTWEKPEVEKLDVTYTERGNSTTAKIDEQWTDQNGKLWTSRSGGNETADERLEYKD